MVADEALTRRAELAQLRRLARSALAQYGLDHARLRPLRHEHNTTFQVAAGDSRYVLRINRTGVHTRDTIASEMAWLRSLRAETELAVPEPVATADGSLVVVATDREIRDPRVCVLLRWLDGRFVDAGLTPTHLRRVARLEAALQQHAGGWSPPSTFVRPRVDTLTNAGKVASMASSAETAVRRDHPAHHEVERSRSLVAGLVSRAAVTAFDRAVDVVWRTTRALASEPAALGLIHGDLHQENYLFRGDVAMAIDFDDCGWGFLLYDLAVTLSELEDRRAYPELRRALLDEYARHRALPADHDRHLAALAILRRLQLLMWVLEAREQPAFRDDWRAWSQKEVDGIAKATARA